MSMSPATAEPASASVNRHSPCIGICRLNETSGWCEGCGRSGSDIAAWMDADDARRLEIWSELPSRLAQLGMDTRVLPWTSAEIIGLIADRMRAADAMWSVARPSTARIFTFAPAGSSIEQTTTGLVARGTAQSFAITSHDKLRAFADVPADAIIALGLPKGRAQLPVAETVTDLGSDTRSLDGDLRTAYDLGLGQPAFRLAVRAVDDAGSRALARLSGADPRDAATHVLRALPNAPLVLIAETVLTRIETRTTGAELPGLLASAEDPGTMIRTPPGLVPAWAAPIAFGHQKVC